MQGIINFEYLISPALDDGSSFLALVNDLKLISDLLDIGVLDVCLEENIITKMNDFGYYPSDKIFQKTISRLEEKPPFGANDIVKYINYILNSIDEFMSDYIIEWESETVQSCDIDAITDQRKHCLLNEFQNYSLLNFINSKRYTPFYFHNNYVDSPLVLNFKGIVSDTYPEINNGLPMHFCHTLEIVSNIKHFLYRLDGFNLFKEADTPLKMKLALYIGALTLIRDNFLEQSLEWDDFRVSDSFIKSLQENEACESRQYSSVTYNTIINLLASTGKCEVNFFYKSDDPSTPRKHGEYTAYRVHITKQNRGLRLLFWDDEYEIVISNVGNKNECLIYSP